MGKNLKMLENLQNADLKLDALLSEKETFLSEIAALEKKWEDLQSDITEKNAALQSFDEERQSLEENLQTETDNIAKSETRLHDIKTQKEYQAVSKEIAAAKKIKTEIEEQLMQKLAQADELKTEVANLDENATKLQENLATQKSELLGKIDEIEKNIATENSVRESVAGSITASVLKRYTKLRERRHGLAVAEARNGSCLGCNMNLPPQVYNDLFKADSLISCPHCQRLLYLHQEENTTE